MPTQKKQSKTNGKKPQVKVADMKPRKDAKGGFGRTNNKPMLEN